MRSLAAICCIFVLESLALVFVKQPIPLFWNIFFAIVLVVNILIDLTSIVLSFGNPFWEEPGPLKMDNKIGFSSGVEVQNDPSKKARR